MKLESNNISEEFLKDDVVSTIVNNTIECNYSKELNFLESIASSDTEILEKLDVSLSGLSNKDAQYRKKMFNKPKNSGYEISFVKLIGAIGGFPTITLFILNIIAIIIYSKENMNFDEQIAMIVIISIIMLFGLLTLLKTKRSQEIQFDFNKVKVYRNGALESVGESNIVIGDLVMIETGSTIPGDGILIKANDLKIDESCATGEIDLIGKVSYSEFLAQRNFIQSEFSGMNRNLSSVVVSGTICISGEGLAVMIATGDNSYMGKIKCQLYTEDPNTTKLQEELRDIIRKSFIFTLMGSLIILIIFMIWFMIDLMNTNSWESNIETRMLIGYLIIPV